MRRRDFKLFDVIDTEGRTAGLKSNSFPLDFADAEKLAKATSHGKPKIVRTKNRAWEDYVYHSRKNK